MSKDEVSSPIVSLEAMILSCTIDAKEDRYILLADIPGAFLHTDMDEDVHMILEGTIAEQIVKLDIENTYGILRKERQCFMYN